MQNGDADDPKGLIFEAYRIAGITKAECRSIFLDWALSFPAEREIHAALRRLIDTYGSDVQHPMTDVMREGLHAVPTPRRRGGWRSRKRD